MANDRKILGVTLTADGADDVEKAFASLGKEGEDAAKRIKKAFENVNFKGDLTAEVKKELAGMGKAGEEAAAKINAALAKVGIGDSVTARIVRLRRSFAELNDSFRLTRSGFGDIAKGASDMAAGVERGIKVVGAFSLAVGGLFAATTLLAKSSADTAEQIQNQATAFGVSFENMQRLRNVISEVGGDEGLLERALTKFTAGLEGTNEAADNAAEALAKLQKQKSADLKAADSQAEKDKVNAKYRDKITEATQKLQKAQAVFNSTTEAGFPGLLEYAQRLNGVGDSQKQLAQVTQDFGAKGAVTLLAFLQNLAGEFNAAEVAANKMLPALDELGQTNLQTLDQASDKLSTNFSRLYLLVGSRIAPAFSALYDSIREIIGTVGPALADALGGIATAIAEKIIGNKDAIIDFAKGATASVIQFSRDVIDALNSINSSDSSNWIVKLKNDTVGAFNLIRDLISNVLVPAFQTFGKLLEPLATMLNALFGTEFTGNSLAAVAVLAQLTGGFKLVKGAIELAWGAGKLFLDWTLFLPGKIKVVIDVITSLLSVAKGASVALVALIAANPEIALIAGAVVGLTGFIIYLKSQQDDLNQSTIDAKKVSDEYTEALKKATDGTRESTAALLEKQEALLNNRREAIIDARDAVAAAEQQVAEAEANAKSIAGFRAQFAAQNQLRTAKSRLSAATADLALKERNLQDAQSRVAAGQKALSEGLNKTGAAAAKAVQGVSQFKTINLYGPGGLIKSFQVLPEKVLEARRAAQALKDSLEKPGDNALLDAAQAKAEQFISTIGTLGDQIQQALIDMSAAASAQLQALADAMPAFFDGVPAALGQVFSGVGTTFTNAWRVAMASIVEQTRQMVSSVSGLINSLKSTLSSLTSAIRSASSQSGGSSGLSGGGGRGFSWGGLARGPGTGTSDSIPARLSAGEYVLRAAAVNRLPLEFLHALNSARFDLSEVLNRFMHTPLRFAGGGLVPQAPRLSLAGVSAGARGGISSPVTLVIGGEKFTGFNAGQDAIQRLDRAMKHMRLTSTGRPNAYGY